MDVRWIWVRHGETEDNRSRRYLGHYDAPLNKQGREQAFAAAERLKNEPVTYIYTSDLLRCKETAHIIACSQKMTVVETAALRELDFGQWDRKTYEEIMRTHKSLAEKWYNNPYDVSPPEGESLYELGDRIGRWLSDLEERMLPTETAVLVTHGGPIRWFLAEYLLGDPGAFWSVRGPGTGDILITEKYGQTWRSSSL